ncbi:MAG: TetR/AcrR family transcriptional regulator [Fimbriimonadaceae bacterium]|nr:MAG: TetR/AcrR family transcriptional regulator [Fimbriimonadaceae bacterium]
MNDLECLEQATEACDKRLGRPRCPVAHQKILASVLEELETSGYDGLTIEGVAHRAQVGKATIYRRWHGKSELLLDALLETACESIVFHETGDFPADLKRQMYGLVDFFNGPHRKALKALFAATQSDEELAENFRSAWMMKRKCVIQSALQSEIGEGRDAAVILDMLYAPLYFRLIVGHEELSYNLVDQVIESVLPA